MPKKSVRKVIAWKELENATLSVKELFTQTEKKVLEELHGTEIPFCRWFVTPDGMQVIGEGFEK